MDTKIDRADWPAFADGFSEANQGRPVTLELVGDTLGAAEMTEATPLVALDYDDKGEEAILITVGEAEEEMTHTISAPSAVWLHKDLEGVDSALEIVTADEAKVILKFGDEEV